MNTAAIRLREPENPEAWADALECQMLVENRTRLSRASIRREVRNTTALDDESVEVIVEELFIEVRERRKRGGAVYPFGLVDDAILLQEERPWKVYAFLLLLCVSVPFRGNISGRVHETDLLFDYVVASALRGYLGPRATITRFGWPIEPDRPREFDAARDWLAQKLRLTPGMGAPSPEAKDGGVDVVAWLPFADSRGAFLTLLTQCTVQEKEWERKAQEVKPQAWARWIDFGVPPVAGLAVPFQLPAHYPRWEDFRSCTTVFLDRFRLCEHIVLDDLQRREKVEEWVERELQNIRVAA